MFNKYIGIFFNVPHKIGLYFVADFPSPVCVKVVLALQESGVFSKCFGYSTCLYFLNIDFRDFHAGPDQTVPVF